MQREGGDGRVELDFEERKHKGTSSFTKGQDGKESHKPSKTSGFLMCCLGLVFVEYEPDN